MHLDTIHGCYSYASILNGPGKEVGLTEIDCRNYYDDMNLACQRKGLVIDEEDFLTFVDESFTSYY